MQVNYDIINFSMIFSVQYSLTFCFGIYHFYCCRRKVEEIQAKLATPIPQNAAASKSSGPLSNANASANDQLRVTIMKTLFGI